MENLVIKRLLTKDNEKAQAFMMDNDSFESKVRCAGLKLDGSRCKKHAMSQNDMCHQHISQVGRVVVHCSDENCFSEKIMPLYQDDDGSLFYDHYSCKLHDRLYAIRKFIKINGVSVLQVDSKCLECGKEGGKAHGYYCPNCAPKAEYDVMKRCLGTTLNDERCSRQKIMLNNGGEYLCKLHQSKERKKK